MMRSPSLLEQRNDIIFRMRGPVKPDDIGLIQLIKTKFLLPPASHSVPYNLRHENSDIEHEYKTVFPTWVWIDSILKDFYPQEKHKGFFVEAGALDGEFLSNTLRLEMEQGWTGLLVEPDKDNFNLLKEANRKAWLTPTCLAMDGYPESVILSKLREDGAVNWLMRATTFVIKNEEDTAKEITSRMFPLYEEAQCLPTQSLLMALNVSHVDFFSLDIEKAEEPVLDHFPFDRISVDVWAIEHRREEVKQKFEDISLQLLTLSDLRRLGFEDKVIRYREQIIQEFEDQRFIKNMISRGYYYFDSTCSYVGDYIFVRKESDLYKRMKVPKEQENRTDICKDKEIHASPRTTIPIQKLRDSHHYPNIEYQELL